MIAIQLIVCVCDHTSIGAHCMIFLKRKQVVYFAGGGPNEWENNWYWYCRRVLFFFKEHCACNGRRFTWKLNCFEVSVLAVVRALLRRPLTSACEFHVYCQVLQGARLQSLNIGHEIKITAVKHQLSFWHCPANLVKTVEKLLMMNITAKQLNAVLICSEYIICSYPKKYSCMFRSWPCMQACALLWACVRLNDQCWVRPHNFKFHTIAVFQLQLKDDIHLWGLMTTFQIPLDKLNARTSNSTQSCSSCEVFSQQQGYVYPADSRYRFTPAL